LSDLPLSGNFPCPTHLLDPGERAIWCGRPDPWRYAIRLSWWRFLLGFIIAVTIAFVVGSVLKFDTTYDALLLIAVIVVGVALISLPFRRYAEAKIIIYLLTDKRAVVVKKYAEMSTRLESITRLEWRAAGRNLGDVLFMDHEFTTENGERRLVRDGFIGIPEAEAVAREMRRLQAAAS
jgi:hypothetical protein